MRAIGTNTVLDAIRATDEQTAVAVLSRLNHQRLPIIVEVITQAQCDAVAAMRRTLDQPPAASRMMASSENYPFEPCIWPEPIIIEPGRTPGQEAA